ncbi:MAG: nucleotidyltransferase domain-containing protein, partial [Candidatus Lokiarchaeota archaeon]|nr:nucleotidyltransferase domain-containing protein [Candidatus Lokiarchaeota archaeon]
MEGLIIFGSVCQKTHDFYSDIDLIVYLENEQIDIKEEKAIRGIITKQIRSIEDDILINFDLDDKWVIYTKKNLIKLEIKIKSISKAKEDIVFIVES